MAAELAFNVFLGLIMALFLFKALQLPATDNPSDILGAGGYPVILGILGLIVLAAITIRVMTWTYSFRPWARSSIRSRWC